MTHGARSQSLTRWFSASGLCAFALPVLAAACSGAPEGAITDGPSANAVDGLGNAAPGNGDASNPDEGNAQRTPDSAEDPTLLEAQPSEDEAFVAGDGEPMLARVVVERSATADGDKNAQAFAHFVEMRAGSDRTLELVGLGTRLPALPAAAQDRCRADRDADTAALDGASLARLVELELLDAGAIAVRLTRAQGSTDDGSLSAESVVSLAPHAFPSVSSFASGLVYTTRDRSAEALPSDAFYTVTVSGVETGSLGSPLSRTNSNRENNAAQVPALSFAGQAPRDLAQVTLGGVPLESVRGVKAGDPLDVTWDVGQAGDTVYVELSRADDGRREIVCVFPDEAGAGSVNAELMLATKGEHRLSVHRLRSVVTQSVVTQSVVTRSVVTRSVVTQPEVGNGSTVQTELQFDFELSRTLIVGDEVLLEEPVVEAVPVDAAPVEAAPVEAAPIDAAPVEAVP